jgi:small subunit ribosomal protein S8
MAMNDPLGDMLTRIRNAQMRKRGKVSTPGSSLRKNVLDVLEAEGYIRGYSTTDYGNGRTEFEIELKYLARVQAGPPGLCDSRRDAACC